MEERLEIPTTLPARQWLAVLTGMAVVAVPWWLGLMWLLGALD